MSQKATLPPKKLQAVEQLLLTGSVTAAAAAVGISRSQLHKWLKEPAFRQAVTEAESVALGELRQGLLNLRSRAILALRQVLDDPDTPASARVRAADVIIGRLLTLNETALEQRVAELEKWILETQNAR